MRQGLTAEEIRKINQRLDELVKENVKETEEKSGELNMSGCATGYCMAWA